MTFETNNRVLKILPDNVREAVAEKCERVDLEGGTVLARAGERANTVHFPESCVISTLQTYSDGSMIEMGNIGCEACSGVNLTLGYADQLNTNEIQVGGSALEMQAESFTTLKEAHPEFERALFSNVQAVFYQTMVSGGCNGAHDSKQRLARWLLTMNDRNDGETMRLTHEFLGQILGLRRATVTNAASELQEAGLIEYSRGRVTITDHEGLRQASCECYDLVRRAYDSILPEPA